LNAEVVYQVAKALPKEEQKRLLEMLQKELGIKSFKIDKLKLPVLSKEEATKYLLKNVLYKNSILVLINYFTQSELEPVDSELIYF
jgi:hypothetical protein